MARLAKPNYTQVPDEVLDRWMAELTGAEFKVLLYICRRTFGFRRDSDTISLEQFSDGIVTASGKRLDHGTGLSRRAVIEALERLDDELKLVVPEKTKGPDGRQQVTVYRLNLHEPGAESAPGQGALLDESRVQKSNPQETVERQTVESSPPTPLQAEHGAGQDRDKAPQGAASHPEPVLEHARADTPPNLTGSLQVVIERECRRLRIRKAKIKPGALVMLEQEDTGEDYRRAMAASLERFAIRGDPRATLGNWGFEFVQGWRVEQGSQGGREKFTREELGSRNRERERKDPRQAWRGNGAGGYHQSQLDDKERIARAICKEAGVDYDASLAAGE